MCPNGHGLAINPYHVSGEDDISPDVTNGVFPNGFVLFALSCHEDSFLNKSKYAFHNLKYSTSINIISYTIVGIGVL